MNGYELSPQQDLEKLTEDGTEKSIELQTGGKPAGAAHDEGENTAQPASTAGRADRDLRRRRLWRADR